MKALIASRDTIMKHGEDILLSESMQATKQFIQHGDISVFEHCFCVACLSVYIAARFHIRVNKRALVRGALLHDYFLYDWHVPNRSHRLHGFTHARRALKNAARDFELDPIEGDIIAKHMFPLNISPPRYRESLLVCLADKICATCETLSIIKRK